MGGIGDAIFGTKPKVSSKPPIIEQRDKYSPEQQQLLSSLLGYVQPTVGQPGTAYPGQFVSGLSPMEQSAMGTLGDYSERFTSPEDYYSTMIEEPLMKAWKEDVIPTIGGEFGKRGLFYGGGEHGRRAAELDSAESLMNVLAKGRIEAETQTLQNVMGITGREMEMGGVSRGIEQMELSAEYEDWARTQPGVTPEMTLAMQLLGVNPYEFFQGEHVVTPGTTGLLQQAIGAAGPVMSGLGAMGVTP